MLGGPGPCVAEIPVGLSGGCGPLPWTVLARFILALPLIVAGFAVMLWASRPGMARVSLSKGHDSWASLMIASIGHANFANE